MTSPRVGLLTFSAALGTGHADHIDRAGAPAASVQPKIESARGRPRKTSSAGLLRAAWLGLRRTRVVFERLCRLPATDPPASEPGRNEPAIRCGNRYMSRH